MRSNYIFYHCTPINDYKDRFMKTWSKIEKSGILTCIDRFFLMMNGDSDFDFSHDKITKITCERWPNESKTANYIKNFSQDIDANILYLHNKGVTKIDNQNINYWVDLMEFFLIEKYYDCITILDTKEACGVNLQPFGDNVLHFSGNFWWARSRHLRDLMDCDILDHYGCEKWHLGGLARESVHSFFNTNKNLYHEKINREEYDRDYKNTNT